MDGWISKCVTYQMIQIKLLSLYAEAFIILQNDLDYDKH